MPFVLRRVCYASGKMERYGKEVIAMRGGGEPLRIGREFEEIIVEPLEEPMERPAEEPERKPEREPAPQEAPPERKREKTPA